MVGFQGINNTKTMVPVAAWGRAIADVGETMKSVPTPPAIFQYKYVIFMRFFVIFAFLLSKTFCMTKEPLEGYVYILTNPSFKEDWVKE